MCSISYSIWYKDIKISLMNKVAAEYCEALVNLGNALSQRLLNPMLPLAAIG